MAQRSQHNAWNEVYALILLGTGTLLFLALISYVPKDIPTWFPLFNSTSLPNRPAENFLGPLGAVGAGICYFLVGAASYLLAATFLGFGGAKLFHGELKVSRRLGWIVLAARETKWQARLGAKAETMCDSLCRANTPGESPAGDAPQGRW